MIIIHKLLNKELQKAVTPYFYFIPRKKSGPGAIREVDLVEGKSHDERFKQSTKYRY
jgi:hypothetical protein